MQMQFGHVEGEQMHSYSYSIYGSIVYTCIVCIYATYSCLIMLQGWLCGT